MKTYCKAHQLKNSKRKLLSSELGKKRSMCTNKIMSTYTTENMSSSQNESKIGLLTHQILPFMVNASDIPFFPLLQIEYIHPIRPPTVTRTEISSNMRI